VAIHNEHTTTVAARVLRGRGYIPHQAPIWASEPPGTVVLFYAEGPFIANTHVLCWHELQGKQGFFSKPV
jgi:hypothetical protein